ncbi:SCO4225 family membrane protein [Streptomyces sp. NPDC059909]|uniref:SCO4225 family membrane protein n=1 Tax=Streptomyces sp. NPDC059909 TaxID=3346998 RepID=UPI0036685917
MNTHGRLGRIARLTFGNPASLVYLGLVAVATLLAAYDTLFVHHEDASFAWLMPMLLTAPTFFVVASGGEWLGDSVAGSYWFPYLALVVSALIQAFALGWFVRMLHGRPRSAHPRGV